MQRHDSGMAKTRCCDRLSLGSLSHIGIVRLNSFNSHYAIQVLVVSKPDDSEGTGA